MIDDQIGHDVKMLAQRADRSPITNTRIYCQMVAGIKSGISSINRIVEWQEVYPSHHPRNDPQLFQSLPPESIHIGDQLNPVLHPAKMLRIL